MIEKAVALLKAGKLIGLPTETVYGLAADAKNDEAIKKIFSVKGRPTDHPLIVHIGSFEEINDWAETISPEAHILMQEFWPGPLTLILKKQAHVSNLVTANQDSVGLRMPNHPMAQALLQAFGGGVAAPSANQFGHISPTCAEDVFEELQDKVDLILPGGAANIGIESTIVDARTTPVKILRPGAITKAMLEEALQQEVITNNKTTLKVSGNLASHYAPRTPLILMSKTEIENTNLNAIFLIYSKITLPENSKIIQLSQDPKSYAHDLYKSLRQADHAMASKIIVEQPPTEDAWEAINERLAKAATH
jgi:L-threonylcarbamoyladenylate synthase